MAAAYRSDPRWIAARDRYLDDEGLLDVVDHIEAAQEMCRIEKEYGT